MIRRYVSYLKYLFRHKYFVFIECYRRGIAMRGLLHDISKFRLSEFFPYARSFYNPDGSHKEYEPDDSYDKAWLLHQKRNPHHWQYWVLIKDDGGYKALIIPYEIMLEMICDWIGAGKAQGYISPPEDPYLEVRNWYLKNKTNMILHEKTRRLVELYIGLDCM